MATERSANAVPVGLAKSNAGNDADVILWADPSTHRLLVDVSGGGGTSSTDDAAFTAASGSGTPMMGFVTADSVDSGDVGVLAMLSNRQLKVTLYTAAGVEATVGGGTQYTEDAASAGGESLTLAGAVRQDTIASSVSLDGDYANLKVNSVGRLYTSATIDAALPAGTNAIGKLAANTGVDIGDVDVTSLPATSNAGATAKTFDLDSGVGTDTVTAFGIAVAASGGSVAITGDTTNGLDVDVTRVSGNVTVVNAGTFATQVDGAALTALQKIDDPVLVDDAAFTPATSSVMMAGAEFDDTVPDSVDEGDAGALRMSANRNLYVRIRDNAGNERGLNIDANGALAATVTNATASNLNAQVVGEVAHDAADSGNPVKIGLKAYAFDGTAPQTASAEADRVNAIADLQGIQYTQISHPNFWHVSADYAAAQTNTTVKAAPGVGLSLFITDISISNGATAGNVTLLDGSAGTVLYELYPAINGGAVLNLRNPIKLTSNTLLAITSTTVTTHTVFVAGFIA